MYTSRDRRIASLDSRANCRAARVRYVRKLRRAVLHRSALVMGKPDLPRRAAIVLEYHMSSERVLLRLRYDYPFLITTLDTCLVQ